MDSLLRNNKDNLYFRKSLRKRAGVKQINAMKTNKLNLNKEIIANLSDPESSQAKGGNVTVYTCAYGCGNTNTLNCTDRTDCQWTDDTCGSVCLNHTQDADTGCYGFSYVDCTYWVC